MQFRRLVFPLVVVVITIVSVGISPAFAVVCPPGKVPTTIQNPVGKIIELCVPAEAVNNIGGNNDIVIPGRCPCFSQDDLDPIFAAGKFSCIFVPGMSDLGTCTLIKCISPDIPNLSINLEAQEGPYTDPADKSTHGCRYVYPPEWPENMLKQDALTNNLCYAWINPSESLDDSLKEADGDACVTILNSFVVKQ